MQVIIQKKKTKQIEPLKNPSRASLPSLLLFVFVQLRGFMAVLIQTHHPGTEGESKSGRGGEELGGQMAGNIKLQKTSKERA